MRYNNVRKGDEDYKEFKNLITIIITIINNYQNNEFYRLKFEKKNKQKMIHSPKEQIKTEENIFIKYLIK